MEKPKRTFTVEPAVGWFIWPILALLMAMWLWMLIDMYHNCTEYAQWYGPVSWDNVNVRIPVYFGIAPLGFGALAGFISWAAYGKVTIQDDCFEFHRLFSRPQRVYYSEFNYYGIEYVIAKKLGKIWYIYFRREKKPEKYLHTEEKGIPAEPVIKFRYREDLYKSLIYYLPEHMATMLKSYHSYEVFDYFKKKHKAGNTGA